VSLRSFVGHRAREALVHISRFWQPSDWPRVMVFLSDSGGGDLRGSAVGKALRELGWRVTIIPPQLELQQRERLVRREKPSVILFQQTRHPFNHPRYYPDIPCVLDVDDADLLDARYSERIIECASQCRAVIAGSHWLADSFRRFNKDVSVVWTGSYIMPNPTARAPSRRDPIVTWASSDPFGYPAEAALIRQVILKLAGSTSFEFRLYGVNDVSTAEEYLEPFKEAGVKTKTYPTLSYYHFIKSLEDVAVGLHPVCMDSPFSQGKSFGKLLAYMAAQVAIVTSREIDHPRFFRDGESAALIENNNIDAWVASTRELIENPKTREAIATAASRDYQRLLTSARAAQQIDPVLRRVMTSACAHKLTMPA
jgi:hypothetical protein